MVRDLDLPLRELSAIAIKIKRERDENTYVLLLEEFLDIYDVWQSLSFVAQSIESSKDDDMRILLQLSNDTLIEIQQVYEVIRQHCRNFGIVINKRLMEEYERKAVANDGTEHKILISVPIVVHCYRALQDIVFSLLEKKILLALIDNGSAKEHLKFISGIGVISEQGDIKECTFAPAYDQWIQKREAIAKAAVWYSWDQLLYFKNTKRPFNDDVPFGNKEGPALYCQQNIMLGFGQRVSLSDYTLHVERLYEYTKQMIQHRRQGSHVVLDIHYDGDTGEMIVNGYRLSFEIDSIEGKMLFAISPGGYLIKDPMPLDEIGAEVFGERKMSKTDKDKLYKARDRINAKIEEIVHKKDVLVSDKKGNMFRNPEYIYKN